MYNIFGTNFGSKYFLYTVKNIYIFRKKFDLPERVRSNRYPRTGSDKAIEIYGYSCPRNDERRRRCIDNWRKIRVTKSPRRGRDCIERLCRFPPNEP